MSNRIGFSTGALALGDFEKGLDIVREKGLSAIEISALREEELKPLLQRLPHLDLSMFDYVSVHAPSKLILFTEHGLVHLLSHQVPPEIPIIVHPDVIQDFTIWSSLGASLCLENMDKRKPIGRTVMEMSDCYSKLPEASFCLDLGHARQCDPTMSEAVLLIKAFSDRLRQIHLSEVNSSSRHEGISYTAMLSFSTVAHLVPDSIPIILETLVCSEDVDEQIGIAKYIFETSLAGRKVSSKADVCADEPRLA